MLGAYDCGPGPRRSLTAWTVAIQNTPASFPFSGEQFGGSHLGATELFP